MVKTLPFNHNAKNLYEAVGISSKKIEDLIENPSKFDSLSSEEKLRITACLGHLLTKMIINTSPAVIGTFFILGFDKEKSSQIVENIEKNLLELAKEREEIFFKYILKAMFEATIYCIKSIGAITSIVQSFINNLELSEEIQIH